MSDGLVKQVLLSVLTFACLLPGAAVAEVVTWDGGQGDSMWHSAANWNPNHRPISNDDVIIDLPGTYAVILLRDPTHWPQVASLSVEAAGATLRFDGRYGATGMYVADGFTNAGTFELIGGSESPRNVHVAVQNGTLINTGTIDVLMGSGGGGARGVYGAMDNRGTINIGTAATIGTWTTSRAHVNSGTINVTGGSLKLGLERYGVVANFTNTGTFNIAAGQTLVIDSGTFTNFGSQTLTGGTYNVAGTFKFTGADIVNNAATIVLDGPASQIVDDSDGDALASFAANEASGSFTITNGRDLTTPGAFANAGAVGVSRGSPSSATHKFC